MIDEGVWSDYKGYKTDLLLDYDRPKEGKKDETTNVLKKKKLFSIRNDTRIVNGPSKSKKENK